MDLTDEEVNALRTLIDEKYQTEGDLRRVYSLNIKRLTEIGSSQGTSSSCWVTCSRSENTYKCSYA